MFLKRFCEFLIFLLFVNSSYGDCGVQVTKSKGFVYNGAKAEMGEYPWIAPLFTVRRGEFFCGSSIITERHLLTGKRELSLNNRDLFVFIVSKLIF